MFVKVEICLAFWKSEYHISFKYMQVLRKMETLKKHVNMKQLAHGIWFHTLLNHIFFKKIKIH